MTKFKVIGTQSLLIDGRTVTSGETFEADPEDPTPGAVNITALLQGGHVEEVKHTVAKKTTGGDK